MSSTIVEILNLKDLVSVNFVGHESINNFLISGDSEWVLGVSL